MFNRSVEFRRAMQLLYEGRGAEAVEIAKRLTASSDEKCKLSGHLCAGLIYEQGTSDAPQDLDRAILHFHRAAVSANEPLTFCYLARASMKKGLLGYPDALKHLQQAASLGRPAEVLLGFAQYYRTKMDPDVRKAKGYYLRAALRGRFAGFFGYASISRELGQTGRALAMDILRIVLGPILALLVGPATQDVF